MTHLQALLETMFEAVFTIYPFSLLLLACAVILVGAQLQARHDVNTTISPSYDQYVRDTALASAQIDMPLEPLSEKLFKEMMSIKPDLTRRSWYGWPDWFRTGWFKKSVALICGAATLPETVWTDMFNSCQEFDSSRIFGTGAPCVYKAVRSVVASAMAAPAAYAAAAAVWNNFAGVKRDGNATQVADLSAALDATDVSVSSSAHLDYGYSISYSKGNHEHVINGLSTEQLVDNGIAS